MKHQSPVSSETAGMHAKAIDRPSVTDAPREHAKDPSQEMQEHTTEAPRENIRSKTPAGTY